MAAVYESEYQEAKVQTTLEDGTEIRITSEGRFLAKVNGRVVARTSIAAIKRVVNATNAPLHCMQLNQLPYESYPVEITGVSGDNLIDKDNKRHKSWLGGIYLLDEAAISEVNALIEEYKALQTRFARIKNRLQEVKPYNFKALFNKQQKAEQPSEDSSDGRA